MINEIVDDREVFEIAEDTVDDFDQLNQQNRKDEEWMVIIFNFLIYKKLK